MRIFVFSDAHNDINNIKNRIKDFIPNNADLYIDCGDTSGSVKDTINFYSDEFWKNKRVLIVGGNHLCYCGTPLDEAYKLLKEKFHLHNNITFLENDYIKIDNTIFVGATLWTDFGCDHDPLSKIYVQKNIQDYKQLKFTKDVKITPNNILKLHNYSLKYLESKLKKFKKHNVVFITHHAPSSLSNSEIYKFNRLNSAYYSNLGNFICQYDNLKLWCHGHIHTSSNYEINKCSVVCNPIGYLMYEDDFVTGYSKNKIINFHTIKD